MKKIKDRPTPADVKRLMKKYAPFTLKRNKNVKGSALELLLKERGSYEDYINR